MSAFTKSIELAVRRQFNKWFRADREPVVVNGPQNVLDIGQTPRILVLRQDRLGDILISTPLVRALRARYPNARIDALLSDNNIGAKRAYEPYINDILRYKKSIPGIARLRNTMQSNEYDVVVDLTDNASSTSSMLVAISKARFAVGIDKENRGAYTHVMPRVPRDSMHIVDRIARLLWPFGVDDTSIDKHMEYRITDAERTSAEESLRTSGSTPSVASQTPGPEPLTTILHRQVRIGINISGSTASRRLEAGTVIDFVSLVRKAHTDIEFYVFTTPDLIDVQRAICTAPGAIAVNVSKSFHAYACVLSCMDALVTPDTAAVHLAAAWKMPSVVLYHPEVPAVHPWFPYDSYSVPLMTGTPSVANISASDVATGIEKLLRETGLAP